jgi:2-oxoglutarate dehydrogenase E1 component
VIDLVGYRRHGHNELDQPMFTQPSMYKVIQKHPTALRVYQKKLIDEKSFTAEEVKKVEDDVMKVHEAAYANSKDYVSKKEEWLSSRWVGFKGPGQLSRIRNTGVSLDVLKAIGDSISVIPKEITPHRMVAKIFEAKKASVDAGSGLDWATAEALAFGTLLQEGNHVRISGQDVERGTFSHRHAVVTCNNTAKKYTPLANIPALNGVPPAIFTASNSPLSEFGVLGFELGYSLENPNQLVIWEAQFGDFVNGAQIIIDNFLSSGESKWMRQSGLVMLLPHGYDGQGAEHSSCRIERFLQSCDDDPDSVPPMSHEIRQQIQLSNWQIVNITTPANYYHVLRRQVHREFRKPLIVAAPKALLKLKACSSTLEDMGPGTKFKRVIPDPSTTLASDDKIRKVAFCSGKIYYELAAEREKKGINDIALVRLEQIAPFPFDKVAEQVSKYPNAAALWVQEEPKNMGAYSYVFPRFRTATEKLNGQRVSPKVRSCPHSLHAYAPLHSLIYHSV